VDDPEIQSAAIDEMQCELESEAVKAGDVEGVMTGHASLHVKVRRHRLTSIGKMLVDVEMIVHASDQTVFLEHFAIAHRLLYQSLHVYLSAIERSFLAPASPARGRRLTR
jgi:hypothetical protein